VSWELASFLVLGLVLAGGFAWYELKRPPSQVVALVAALAALAVAGRVALAPIPNVVATTDIVLFAGYAIGAAPGFAVGALAGLVSNFWLGQGPWTPWQMAGWGLTGVFGAGLCLVTRGRAGRLTLTAACGLAGVLYGALLNFSLMASYGGELSWARFLTLEVRAIPFDAAHAIGNIALALVAGPAMIRMLTRFRERFEWRPTLGPAAAPLAGLLLVAVLCAAAAAPPRARAAGDVRGAVHWLATKQNRDGGFSSNPGGSSSIAITNWAMLGFEAAGRNPMDVSRGPNSAVAYLRHESARINSTGDLARTVLALGGAGVEPRHFAGRNLVAELRGRQRRNGSFEGWPNMTAYSVLALRAAGSHSGLKGSLEWLRRVQNRDGGWGVVRGAPSDADTTGAVLQVIRHSRAARRALGYLRHAQRHNGGYSVGGSGAVNTQSTAWAVQGMLAAGRNPARFGKHSSLHYLTAHQARDGHFRYSTSSDQTPVWVTGQVLVAVSLDPLPIAAIPRAPSTTSSTPGPEQQAGREANRNGSAAPPTSAAPQGGRGGGVTSLSGGAAVPGAGKGAGGASSGHSARASQAAGASSNSNLERGASGGGASDTPTDPEAHPSNGDVTAAHLDKPSPLAPLLIGLATTAIVLTTTLWLGRRRGW
jgi:energy-coupling factor transport system substrate-specific component